MSHQDGVRHCSEQSQTRPQGSRVAVGGCGPASGKAPAPSAGFPPLPARSHPDPRPPTGVTLRMTPHEGCSSELSALPCPPRTLTLGRCHSLLCRCVSHVGGGRLLWPSARAGPSRPPTLSSHRAGPGTHLAQTFPSQGPGGLSPNVRVARPSPVPRLLVPSQGSATVATNSRTFPSPQRATPCPSAITPILPSAMENTNLLPVSVCVSVLHTSCSCSDTMCGRGVRLLSLHMLFARVSHVVPCVSTSLPWWLSSVPTCGAMRSEHSGLQKQAVFPLPARSSAYGCLGSPRLLAVLRVIML